MSKVSNFKKSRRHTLILITTLILIALIMCFMGLLVTLPHLSSILIEGGSILLIIAFLLIPRLDRLSLCIREIEMDDYQFLSESYSKLTGDLKLRVGALLMQEGISIFEFNKIKLAVKSAVHAYDYENLKSEAKLKAKQVVNS